MLRITFFLILMMISASPLFSQDRAFARRIDSILCSPRFGGRGYVDKGNKIAAKFIKKKFKSYGLKTFGDDYFQPFTISINTIRNVNGVWIDGRKLTAGADYYIAAASQTTKGTFDLVYLPDSIFENEKAVSDFFRQDLRNKFILTEYRFKELKSLKKIPAKGLVYINHKKMFWHISHALKPREFVVIDVADSVVSPSSKTITIDFKSKYYPEYKTQNIVGYVEGRKQADSFLVITAHYDHLGKMGHEVYFPGANDNASGTSMMLNLADYFSQPENRPDYSLVFMAFSGEEAGLLGSIYYSEHPLFPLSKIKFLVNLDMVGTGSKGITVVNAGVFPQEFAVLKNINEKEKLLKRIKKRGEACNSDHCPFYKKGVPSFFIYTMGDEYTEYHTPTDRYPDIPFTEYPDLFKLMVEFIKSF